MNVHMTHRTAILHRARVKLTIASYGGQSPRGSVDNAGSRSIPLETGKWFPVFIELGKGVVSVSVSWRTSRD